VGGLKAVALTETVQTVLLIGGAIMLTLFGIFALPEAGVGSFAEFKAHLVPDTLSILRSPDSPANPPNGGITWFAAILGYFVLGAWYWFSDQTIVQRALGAKSEYDARVGPMFTALLKLLPVLFFLLPGVLAFVLFQTEIGEETKNTLPFMIDRLMPNGLKGLVIASLLAALMSSVAAAINSASTLFAIDILKRVRTDMSDKKLVLAGRITAVVIMVLAITWSTQAGKFGETIIHTVNSLGAMIAPPITVAFLFGMFWKRGTAKAANINFAVGIAIGLFVFLLDFPYENLLPGFDAMARAIAEARGIELTASTKAITDSLGVVFMMQAWWKFVFGAVLFVVISYLTPKPSEAQIANCMNVKDYWPGKLGGLKDYRVVGISIVALLIVIWTFLEVIAR